MRISIQWAGFCAVAFLALLRADRAWGDSKDLEFVAEHLPEAAMDQRLNALPLFGGVAGGAWELGLGLSRTTSGSEKLSGALFSLAFEQPLSGNWNLAVYGFFDDLKFQGAPEQRPLAVGFSRAVPLQLPADASLSGLSGSARDLGGGALLRHRSTSPWLGRHDWLIGLQWQRVELRDYVSRFLILNGTSAGVAGQIDYSHDYAHLTLLAGIAWPRARGDWHWTPHLLAALPRPVRPLFGRITAPGIDISGDTESAGNGRHFGDPYVAAGLSVGYTPWRLSVDLGALLTQRFVEPRIHRGIDDNWLLSVSVAW